MKMKPQYRKGGYSNQTAEQYVNLQSPIYLLSDEIETQQKFEDGKPTGEIIAYKTWFGQKGLPPFQVKFRWTTWPSGISFSYHLWQLTGVWGQL